MTALATSERGRAIETRLAKEATINTLPTTGWKPRRFYDFTSGMSRDRVKDDQLGVALANSRDPGKRRKGLPGGSLSQTVPLNLNEIGHYLSAGFARAAPTGEDGDFVHVFSSAGDPTDTLALVQKFAANDWSWDLGVALATIRIQAQKAETTARAALTLIGLSDGEGSSAPAGTLGDPYDPEDFSDWRWTALWNGVAVGDLLNVDLTMDCGVERVLGLNGDEYPTRHHFGERDYSGSFKLYGRGKTIRDLGLSDDVGQLTLRATHPDDPTNRYFQTVLEGVQFNRPQRTISGPGQFSADMSFYASQDTENHACAITLANGVTSY